MINAASARTFWLRLRGRWQRTSARWLARRPRPMRAGRATISFTFDDFPRSAFRCGGELLAAEGWRGTYYASLGLMGGTAPTGVMFGEDDLHALVAQGHELGCHTFSHCDASRTPGRVFEAEVRRNAEALARLLPEARFRTLSYPIGQPRPATKRRVAAYFDCCRGGGQSPNHGRVDLNLLSAFFLEQSRDRLDGIRRVIEATCATRGWLIFATHDIDIAPTRFGITPGFFAEVLKLCRASGAAVLPVAEAYRASLDPAGTLE